MNIYTVVAEIEKRSPELAKFLPELLTSDNVENRDTIQFMAYRLGILDTYVTGRDSTEWK